MGRHDATLVRYREARAVELALAGSSWDDIADELGYANRSGAWKAAQRALKARTDAAVDQYRGETLIDLGLIIERQWPAAMRGDVAASEVVLAAMDRRERLLGGYEPLLSPSDPGPTAGSGAGRVSIKTAEANVTPVDEDPPIPW